jgi:hypothetical protein
MLSTQLFREKLKNIFVFSLGHALLIVFALFLGSAIPEKIIYVLFSFAISFISFKTYLSDSKNAYTLSLLIAGEIILFLIFLITLFKEYTFLQPLLNIFSAVYILFFMLYTHISNLDNALEIITDNSIQPVATIRRFNNKIISLFLLIAALVLILCKYAHIQDFIKLLWHGFTWLIHFLFYNENGQELPELIYYEKPSGYSIFDWVRFLRAGAKTSQIAAFMEKLFLHATDIGIVLTILGCIGYGLYLVYRKFYVNSLTAYESKEFISPFVKAKKAKKLGVFNDIFISLHSSNNEKVRKLYLKKIRYYMTSGLKIHNNTSSEISQTANKSIHKDLSELTYFYEKARYSSNEVSKEDLEQVKRLVNKHD